MKLITFLPVLVAVSALISPISAYAKDKDKKDRGDSNRSDNRVRSDYRGRDGDRNRSGSSYSSRSSYGYGSGYGRGYGYGSGYGRGYGYGSGYGSYYGRSPYYYSRPSIGFSYYSRPATVYRSQSVYGSYSDSLAVDVQRELRRRGYYRGSIDGDIGPGSRSAIRAYQSDRGLSATGRIDSSLLRSLGIG